MGIRQILNPFGLVSLLTGSCGPRPPRICCPWLRHSGKDSIRCLGYKPCESTPLPDDEAWHERLSPPDGSVVIAHKRCPTGKTSQQQIQSQNRPVQNAYTSHAAEACRLRASRRAEYASADASGARRKTCQLRAGRRADLRAERRAG